MKIYVLDGNNILGKWNKNRKIVSDKRIELAVYLDRYFGSFNYEVFLFFDGYLKESLNFINLKIIYSNNLEADLLIKKKIDSIKNPKLITLVTSDFNLQQYGKVNSCTIISSETFIKKIISNEKTESEEEKINQIKNDEIKKMFGL